ncbi:MAG: hypothetical protein WBB07_17540 [Mycobacterium sp.]
MPNPNTRERQVILIGKDGKALFHSARCLIAETDDGNYQITDLTRQMNGAAVDYASLPDALVQDGQFASKGAARRALGINEGMAPISENMQQVADRMSAGLAGARPGLPNG